MIPAKDIAGLILKDIQDSVRKELGPDATPKEIREAEWALALAFGGSMFTAKMG
jgi:hypothetical protein